MRNALILSLFNCKIYLKNTFIIYYSFHVPMPIGSRHAGNKYTTLVRLVNQLLRYKILSQ